MPRKKPSQSPRPSSAGSNVSNSNTSSKGKKKRSDQGIYSESGPRLNEDVCISEEVKIGINLALERFRLDETQSELEFPSALTATERAYIHRTCDKMDFTHKSSGKGKTRCITIKKKNLAEKYKNNPASFQLVRNSKYQINNMLQRFPVTSKERLELLPNTDKSLVNEVSKELARTATGRLNNGVAQVPPLRGRSDLQAFTQNLPVNQYRGLILDTISENQVCIVSGGTGSGKTTQVPQMVLDDCHEKKKPCRIFCTQPRRIAAVSVSERVSAERNEKIGQTIGFQIRLESRVSPKTLLTFCTNGVLLRTLMGNDEALSTVTHVFVDEVHERDKFSDFLLISLREIIKRNRHVKVVLMSATMNTDLFRKYFNGCGIVEVPGKLFPVEEYFLEDVLKWTGYTSRKMEAYRRKKAREAAGNEVDPLEAWFRSTPIVHGCAADYEDEETLETEPEKVPDEVRDTQALAGMLANLGVEKEVMTLEPWVVQEMDKYMSETFLTGSEEMFAQVIHLITSENVPVDYQHSQTSVTPLMIAAGRGFTEYVEQLLSMGADPGVAARNEWTALDWAKKFNHQDIIAMLEAHVFAGEIGHSQVDNSDDLDSTDLLTPEDKELLTCYQHSWDDDKVDTALVISLLHKVVTTQPDGAVLVFLPGYDEIVTLRTMVDEDPRFASSRFSLFLLHSSMQTADQKKVFKPSPPGVRKIILATNIAETSITINDVVYVIDAGKVKEKSFDALLQVTMLKSHWISKSSAAQRKGRAGRVQPGVCYHLFSRVRYSHLQDFPTPELLRCPLQELCLQTKLLAPGNVSVHDFLSMAIEAPPFLVIRSALNLLKEMDALDQSEELTELGRHLADLPVDPHLGKMVLNSIVLKCLDPVLTIVCALAYKSPFVLPSHPDEKKMVKQIMRDYSASTFSDHMTLLRLFQSWQKARTEGWESAFCQRNYVSPAVMEMIVGTRAQLLGQLRASGFVRARGGGDIRDLNTNSENWAVVKAALCAGAYPSVIRVDNKKKLVSHKNSHVMIHMSSALSQKEISKMPSDWLFYEEMTQVAKEACVRCCTLVSPITMAIFGGPAKLPNEGLTNLTEEEDSGIGFHGETSDSENEEVEDKRNAMLQLGDWLSFKLDQENAALSLQLRQKWHCLFLRRMRAPSKAWSQMDEMVINAVVNVLTNEEQALGFQQPAGIGQRPRPMSAESIMSGGYGPQGSGGMEEYVDSGRQRFSTSAKKATSTPPQRADFLSPSLTASSGGSMNNSPTGSGRVGSGTSTPCSSPQMGSSISGPSRFFVMKCRNQKQLDQAFSTGAWATSKHIEKKLNRAFQDGKTVHLIFSVQGSSRFQGVAILSGMVSEQSGGKGGCFPIDWEKRGIIPFYHTHHLLNPWDENKRVQVSRDGQELAPSVGEALVKLWDRLPDNSGDHGYDESPAPRWHGNQYGGYPGDHPQGRAGYSRVGQYQAQGEYDGGYQDSEGQYNHGGYHSDQMYSGYSTWGQYPDNGNQRHYHRNQGYSNPSPGSYYGFHNQQGGYQRGGYPFGNQSNSSHQHRNSPVMILQRNGGTSNKK